MLSRFDSVGARRLRTIWEIGRRGSRAAATEDFEVRVDAAEKMAVEIFVRAKDEEGNHRRDDPELGTVRNFCLGLPSEKTARDFERDQKGDRKTGHVSGEILPKDCAH